MNQKLSYQKLETQLNNVAKKNGGTSKYIWPWISHEKKFILIVMIACWVIVLIEYFKMNQMLSTQIKGLSDGFFGFKKVFNSIFCYYQHL